MGKVLEERLAELRKIDNRLDHILQRVTTAVSDIMGLRGQLAYLIAKAEREYQEAEA